MEKNTYPIDALGVLAWLDTFERVDNLILEIRHVQETIASQLYVSKDEADEQHSVGLFEPLRYEDQYLWGKYSAPDLGAQNQIISQDWHEILNPAAGRLPSVSRGCTVLAALWCPEYPVASGAPGFVEELIQKPEFTPYMNWFNRGEHEEIIRLLQRIRSRLSTRNRFSATDDRLYDALRHLQLIKRDLLRDKLVVAYRGLEAFRLDPKTNLVLDSGLARLFVVRRAALYSLELRLEAYRDIVSTVEETLNLSMERDPPPTVRRRRDQGMYTADLADNCNLIAGEITNFLTASVGAERIAEHSKDEQSEIEFIIHRYARQFTSTYRYDRIWNISLAAVGEKPLAAGFVQSSFWMPERPDLQPIIVHEIAHILIRHYYRNLEPYALNRMSDPLGRLLRQISYIFESCADNFVYYHFSPRARETLLRELACDLVGIAVHRTSYLFAQFLELISYGSERMFIVSPSGDIARPIDQLGSEYVTYLRDVPPEWLTRLLVPLAYSKMLLKDDTGRVGYLEQLIHDGVQQAVDATKWEHALWMEGEQRRDWDRWMEMTTVVADVVRHSDFVGATSQWIRKRQTEGAKRGPVRAAGIPHNRYATELDPQVVKSCFGAWLDRLVDEPRMLGTHLATARPRPAFDLARGDIIEAFRKLYLGAPPRLAKLVRPERRLFSHLVDIPWQTAMLSAQDFLGDRRGICEQLPLDQWISGLHAFNWLGRDLYHSALEYVIWVERYPIGRLKAVNRWLESVGEKLKPSGDDRIDAESARLRDILDEVLGTDDLGEPPRPDGVAAFRLCLIGVHEGRIAWADRNQVSGLLPKIGSKLISRFDPARSPALKSVPNDKARDWADLYAVITTEHMNHAGRVICDALDTFFGNKKENDTLIAQLGSALQTPRLDANPIYVKFASALLELIRIVHYLDIRPERIPGGTATKHHPRAGWSAAFARYLDVPVHPRKRLGDESSPYIPDLVPTRSIRLDRFSQGYDPDRLDYGQARPTVHPPGNRPQDVILHGAPLYWIPWDKHGVRPSVRPRGVAPSAQQPVTFWRARLRTPLLGRFDQLALGVAKHMARAGPYSPRIPFFRRQQTGTPFSALIDEKQGTVARIDSHETLQCVLQTHQGHPDRSCIPIPLATISVLLVQRSARLTFVERLLAENVVARSFDERFLSPYRHFKPAQDIGLLTDGWGDIFLVLFGTLDANPPATFESYVQQCAKLESRLKDIIELRKSLFEDTLVVRTETSYTPLAIDTALLNPDQFRSTLSVRFRSTRDGASLGDQFEAHLKEQLNDVEYRVPGGTAALKGVLTYASMAGRNDYQVSTRISGAATPGFPSALYEGLDAERNKDDKNNTRFGRYGVIYDTLRRLIFPEGRIEDHVETTATAISELIDKYQRPPVGHEGAHSQM